MTYKKETYDSAKEILSKRKSTAEGKATAALRAFLTECPEAAKIKCDIQITGSRAAVSVVRGGNVREELTRLKENNLALQKRFHELMQEKRIQEKDITPQYSCPGCKDTGYVEGRTCSCMKALLKSLCYGELNRVTPLENSGFDTFSTAYFKDYPADQRAIMEKIFAYCKEYAACFSTSSPSLLFQGGTGLGKTHLSLAIARAAIEKGCGVIYGSVHNFAVAMEKERFDSPDDTDTNSLLSSCDLLILDDLGTEFTSTYTISMIYNILNTRIMKNLPTIISTNLSGEELKNRYSDRLISRLFGAYNRLGFVGRDVRSQKKRRG